MKHESVKRMWEEYLSSEGEKPSATDRKYSAWHFCDNREDADELAQLVVQGIKRATASLYLSYEADNQELPKVGDYSIITDWDGIAQCIVRTEKVDILPFKDVTAEFAALEGEGDKSLEYWRDCHWRYFSREIRPLGKEPSEDMLVVCEEFEVVYK
ncbi:ASCH domain-containing protein [Lutispora thermophila]|uniref:Uncharacterized protein YhfF n=1 Tax=Lutispora thermophila DSM 19022 TaxID=1122184 RepID=A0A1M6DSA0_9FIRM|nr:ASCH domain-containing protein [Lutispora thermophila]SHI76124.1 Uncharacterized protein YhfF [Lutispora thermophila DSM 19022]